MWVRQGVADALYRASQLLPKGCRFQVWGAWRPLALQQALFDKYVESLRKNEPELSYEDLRKKAQQFISLPSTNPKKPSPHNTGRAVDLTLIGPDGKELDMGTEFDHFGIEAETTYFEHRLREGAISEQEIQILKNRRLLYSIMITAGFTNYLDEWWHYDFGNQIWGRIKGQAAIYGRAVPIELAESDEPCRF